MITYLAFLVFAEAQRLDSAYDAGPLAQAIATASIEAPLFSGPDGAEQTAARLLALAWEESNFRNERVGDGGRACTAFQLHAGARCAALTSDLLAAARAAREAVRTSLAACRSLPASERLAVYTGGACDRGRAASRRRHALALRILAGIKLSQAAA